MLLLIKRRLTVFLETDLGFLGELYIPLGELKL